MQSQELLRFGEPSEEDSSETSAEAVAEVRDQLEGLSSEALRTLERKFEELKLMRETGLGGEVRYDSQRGEWVELYPFRFAPAGEVLDEETREELREHLMSETTEDET